MKAAIIHEFGSKEKLQIDQVEKPQPGEGEVLVRLKASSVNPVDYKIRNGAFQGRLPHYFPLILGWDASGVVEERGHSARRFEEGEEVWAYTRRPFLQNGTYAEYICLPESYLARKPTNLSFEEAAAVPLTGLTAYQSLFNAGNLKEGQTLIVTGASGGVGTMAVQLGKIAGAKVIGIASGRNKDYVLSKLNADEFVDYTQDNLFETLKGKADMIFDTVGGETLQHSWKMATQPGKIVSIAGFIQDKTLLEKYKLSFQYVFVEPHSKQLDTLREMTEDEKLKPYLQSTYKLEDIQKAHEDIETGHTTGKIAIKI